MGDITAVMSPILIVFWRDIRLFFCSQGGTTTAGNGAKRRMYDISSFELTGKSANEISMDKVQGQA
jgi:hypothetical protein